MEKAKDAPASAPEDSAPSELQVAAYLASIQELQKQVKSMEAFANIVIGQRNEAQTQAAQYLAQLQTSLRQQQEQEGQPANA